MQRLLFILALTLAALAPARAQLDVTIEIPRRVFLRGEAIEAKVSIRNLSGHDVVLRDSETVKWFGLEVQRGVDSPIAPYETNYQNPPQSILSGEMVDRTVDLVKLYPVNELGSYSVRATVYFPELQKFIVSRPVKIDISTGKTVWRQTVGVPNGKESAGEYREMSLILFQKPNNVEIYGRVEDQATGTILATYPMGRILGGANPMCEFSEDNTLYVMHMNGPSQYALSKIGINGEWLGQTLWISPTGRATVRKKPDGTMVVVGASRSRTTAPDGATIPKLSDAPPVPIPVPAVVPKKVQ